MVPVLWKESIVVPRTKSRTSKELNDFRPVALTSLAKGAALRTCFNLDVDLVGCVAYLF